MNKRFLRRITCCFLVFIIVFSQAGCQKLLEEDKFYEYKVDEEKLKEIDPLDLSEVELVEEQGVSDSEIDSKEQAGQISEEQISNQPEELEITIELNRLLALRNNLELKVELLDPTIAAEVLSAEEAKFESSFFLNSSLTNSDQPSGYQAPVGNTYVTDITASQRRSNNTELGVNMPLQTGGTVTFRVSDNRRKEISSGYRRNDFGLSPWYSDELSLSISQPLLKGAGRRVNMHSIRIAEYDKQIVDNATKLEVIRLIAASDKAYWNFYAARRQLEVRQQQHELALAQLERAKRFVNAGQLADIEILRAEAGVSDQLSQIITAENTLREQQRDSKKILNKPGVPIDSITVLIPVSEPDPVHYDFDVKKVISSALNNRNELLELELYLAERIDFIDFYKNQTLPLAMVDYRYGLSGVGASRDDSFNMIDTRIYDNHYTGLRLQVPLGNNKAKADLRRQLYMKRRILADIKSRALMVKQEVLNALDSVEASWQKILASRQSSILQGRLYEAEIRQFEVGLRTSTDVLEAQTNFANAQSEEIRALADYQIALVDLAYATGTVLGSAKIDWAPLKPEIFSK